MAGSKAEPALTSASKQNADFPKHSLEQALKVAQALEDKNGGNPMPPMDIAFALGASPGSSTFRDILSAAIKYGLTSGSFNKPKVSLEALGRDVVEPQSDSERTRALYEASLKPDLFRRVFDYYKGKKLPEKQFFANTVVREFNVPKEQADKFVEIFVANVSFLGVLKDGPTGKWLSSDVRVLETTSERPLTDLATSNGGEELPPKLPSSSTAATSGGSRNAIFVGHGKNNVPLQQLEKILTEYRLPYKVATEEASKGRPISQKVADIMHECGAAIIIFTADEEFKDPEGNSVYRPSENAVFELGAASVLYGSRIIIFRDSRVEFPTNFRDIGYITFEEGQLSAKVNELFRELIGFGLIKVSVA